MNKLPLDFLKDLELRAKTHAQLFSDMSNVDLYWYGIGFECLGLQVVVPLKDVSEVLKRPVMSYVPGLIHWLKGIANFRGRLLPITDLTGFLSGTSLEKNHKGYVLVLNGEPLTGLLIDKILGLQRFKLNEKMTEDLDVPRIFQSYFTGQFKEGGQLWYILNLAKILNDENFYRIN
ncbi:MAG: type pili signal transduction protein PilI [Francisellaceae bacterium]|nr:type pili signal transduction protein PilI [Francisellaceae bacterium]